MKRSSIQRLRLLRAFVQTTDFDKPGCSHNYSSLRWWMEAWRDTERLGRTL